MSKEELLAGLRAINSRLHDMTDWTYDEVGAHQEADRLLLSYVNDEEVTDAFDAINKWYE